MARMPDGWVIIPKDEGIKQDENGKLYRKIRMDDKELVMCKSCKHYNTVGCSNGFGWCEDSIVNTGVRDDFYCARGERRD